MPNATASPALSTLEAIEQRRSVKHYVPNQPLPAADKQRLQALAMLSPTSFNIQNWRMVWVEDAALREQLKAAAWDQAQVTDASAVVVFCADLMAWDKQPERYWRNAAQPIQDFLLPAIHAYYADKPQTQRDEALRSCGIAAQTFMLAAKSLGYDTCPMVGFDIDRVAELIRLPDDHMICLMVAIGTADQPAHPRGGSIPLTEAWLDNRF